MNILLVRKLHNYLGLFFAPTILFFSITGAYQLFGLHEDRPGRDYHPPAIVSALGQIHKDQELRGPDHQGPPGAPGPGPNFKPQDARDPNSGPNGDHPPQGDGKGPPGGDHQPKLATTVLKWFFLGGALSVMVSTGFGIWIAVRPERDRKLALALLTSGALSPGLLMVSLFS